jgi:hypothetical protein
LSQIPTTDIKESAHKLIDSLPPSATWDDVMYRIYVRQSIESGLKDVEQGNTTSVGEVRKKFGLPE